LTTKAELSALEKVFAAEIENKLPFQSRAAIFTKLCEKRLIQPMEIKFGGRFPVIVSGWQLTHLGRIIYCSAC
jgi:hypothetical protein